MIASQTKANPSEDRGDPVDKMLRKLERLTFSAGKKPLFLIESIYLAEVPKMEIFSPSASRHKRSGPG